MGVSAFVSCENVSAVAYIPRDRFKLVAIAMISAPLFNLGSMAHARVVDRTFQIHFLEVVMDIAQ